MMEMNRSQFKLVLRENGKIVFTKLAKEIADFSDIENFDDAEEDQIMVDCDNSRITDVRLVKPVGDEQLQTVEFTYQHEERVFKEMCRYMFNNQAGARLLCAKDDGSYKYFVDSFVKPVCFGGGADEINI